MRPAMVSTTLVSIESFSSWSGLRAVAASPGPHLYPTPEFYQMMVDLSMDI
jgi:hypothetical protein